MNAKFITCLPKKYMEVKTMSKIDKNIVPEDVSKTNGAIEDDKKFRDIFCLLYSTAHLYYPI